MTLPFDANHWNALQARVPFKPTFSLDRFGFRHFLSDQCQISMDRRVYCDWMHGWLWWNKEFDIHDFPGPFVHPGERKIITSTPEQAKKLCSYGHDAIAGGLPFSYIPKSRFLRRPETLLAFPTHSTEKYKNETLQNDYLDFLADYRHDFETVCVSLFIYDYKEEMVESIIKRGLVPILGADPFDRMSLLRTRATLDSFSHVSTNVFGSHVAYAMAAGCIVSVHSPIAVNDPQQRADDLGLNRGYVEKSRMVQSEYWLRENFLPLIMNNPRHGVSDIILGEDYVGGPHKLGLSEICSAVGWTGKSRILGEMRRIKFAPAKTLRRLGRTKKC